MCPPGTNRRINMPEPEPYTLVYSMCIRRVLCNCQNPSPLHWSTLCASAACSVIPKLVNFLFPTPKLHSGNPPGHDPARSEENAASGSVVSLPVVYKSASLAGPSLILGQNRPTVGSLNIGTNFDAMNVCLCSKRSIPVKEQMENPRKFWLKRAVIGESTLL